MGIRLDSDFFALVMYEGKLIFDCRMFVLMPGDGCLCQFHHVEMCLFGTK